MGVIWKTFRTGNQPSYATGANGDAVRWSENVADALVFVDSTAADAFASGKNLFSAVQVSGISGVRHHGNKSLT